MIRGLPISPMFTGLVSCGDTKGSGRPTFQVAKFMGRCVRSHVAGFSHGVVSATVVIRHSGWDFDSDINRC
jgi:hypothetical protein